MTPRRDPFSLPIRIPRRIKKIFSLTGRRRLTARERRDLWRWQAKVRTTEVYLAN